MLMTAVFPVLEILIFADNEMGLLSVHFSFISPPHFVSLPFLSHLYHKIKASSLYSRSIMRRYDKILKALYVVSDLRFNFRPI